MLKQKSKSGWSLRSLLGSLLLIFSLVGATTYSAFTGLAVADQFDAQIQQLQDQNSSTRSTATQLGAQASSYQDQVNKLDAQINTLQQTIVQTQQKSDQLQQQINDNQAKLDHQKQVLGENIKAMYLEGQVSTLEILASSSNLSDFVNKEVDRSVVQNKVKTSVDTITTLKLQLQQQQQQLQEAITSLQAERSQLSASESQQSQLLGYTEDQINTANQAIANNNAQIASLRAAQLAANARFIGSAGTGPACGGGYPAQWCEIPQDSAVDNWGMYNRECVSYTAFRVAASGRFMPYWGGRGNANQWDDNARADGIPVDNNPQPGDVAISNAGAFGHAMYVESVNGDGTINVSQYNAALDGTFSNRYNLNPGGLVFIHFP